MQRLRVEKMERQLANLTGLVQKALQVPAAGSPPVVTPRQEFQQYPSPRPPPAQGMVFISLQFIYPIVLYDAQSLSVQKDVCINTKIWWTYVVGDSYIGN